MKHLILFLLCALTALAQAADNPTVEFKTNMGNIVIELNHEKAPKTVENFLVYAQTGFYDGTIFHRVIPDFMVQGGGYTADYSKKPTRDPIVNEANNGLQNVRGSVAMARVTDPNSATSQFFINVKDNSEYLDYTSPTSTGWGYAVFGKVIKGMDIVDEMQGLETGNEDGLNNVPLDTITVNSVIVQNAPPITTTANTTASSVATLQPAPDAPSLPDNPEPPVP